MERAFSRRVGWEDIDGGQTRRVRGVDGADMAEVEEKPEGKSSEMSRVTVDGGAMMGIKARVATDDSIGRCSR